uniref:Hypocretin neuropeptide precursor n=1 Tax=Sphaeramia orbicularis TaxID=375764 RepID=A0A673BIW3_9TELE
KILIHMCYESTMRTSEINKIYKKKYTKANSVLQMRGCCSQPSRGTLTGDAAAGILTLGKRLEDEHRLQSRLHQLLHGSKNQAAGILTMGKRTEEGLENRKYIQRSGITVHTLYFAFYIIFPHTQTNSKTLREGATPRKSTL